MLLKRLEKKKMLKNKKIALLKSQKAVALVITIIMLAAMLMVSAGLYKSVEAGGAVVQNVSLREAGVQAAEKGITEAVTWLSANQGTLTANSKTNGYYAASPDVVVSDASSATKIDFTGNQTTSSTDNVVWDGSGNDYYSGKKLTDSVSGFNVAYIIHRLCSQTGSYDANSTIICSTSTTNSTAAGAGDIAESAEYGNYKITGNTRIAYRVTAKAWGPRGSASYIQTKVLVQYN